MNSMLFMAVLAAVLGAAPAETRPPPPVSSALDECRLPHSAVVFKRCRLGQRWHRGSCAGQPQRLGWKLAMKACPPPPSAARAGTFPSQRPRRSSPWTRRA